MQPGDFDIEEKKRFGHRGIWEVCYPYEIYGPDLGQRGPFVFGGPAPVNNIDENGIYLRRFKLKDIIRRELILLVPLYEIPHLNPANEYVKMTIKTSLMRKRQLTPRIYDDVRACWRKWCHRRYQKAVAQWIQRELMLPGEVAQMISSFI